MHQKTKSMTKLTILPALAGLLLSVSAFAGQEIQSSKDKVVVPDTCFKDHEWQLDVFGAYSDGNALDHAGPLQDHGWGGGVGINYFFTRMLGVGVDGMGLYGRENRQHDGRGGSLSRQKHTTTYAATGSIILRFPMDSACIAPYVYVGGGYTTDGDEWASAHGGLGLEYRVVPNRIGLFVDARFTYYGDRYGNGDQNNLLGKAGVRFVF
jgi:hypothetical protein